MREELQESITERDSNYKLPAPGNCRVLLVRHGTSTKNEIGQHGGDGTLTDLGRQELRAVASRIRRACIPFDRRRVEIYSGKQVQAIQSSEHLSKLLQVDYQVKDELRSLNLGNLDGLTLDEASRIEPEAAERMNKWRQGRMEITNLEVPGGEDLSEFQDRGLRLIQFSLMPDHTYVMVSSRSTLILLTNLLLNHRVRPGGEYQPFNIPNSGVHGFEESQGEWIPMKDLQDFAPVPLQLGSPGNGHGKRTSIVQEGNTAVLSPTRVVEDWQVLRGPLQESLEEIGRCIETQISQRDNYSGSVIDKNRQMWVGRLRSLRQIRSKFDQLSLSGNVPVTPELKMVVENTESLGRECLGSHWQSLKDRIEHYVS